MRNLWKRFSITLIAGALLLSGCSASGLSASKELTPSEVIDKTVKAMSEDSYTYEMKMKQGITTEMFGQEQTVNIDMNTNVDITTKPIALHTKGTVRANGIQMPVEMYMADNAMYDYSPDKGWTKVAVNTSAFDVSQDPTSGLKELEKVFERLGGKTLPKGVSVKKVNGAYVLQVDNAVLQSDPSFAQMLKEQLGEGFKSGGTFSGTDLSQIKIENYKQQVWIDEKTFKQTKTIMDAKVSLPDMKLDQHLELNLKGEYKGKIEVPAEVKNSAKAM
ncbi:MAG: DUF6612 family protein [Thermoactinomyces sp.]